MTQLHSEDIADELERAEDHCLDVLDAYERLPRSAFYAAWAVVGAELEAVATAAGAPVDAGGIRPLLEGVGLAPGAEDVGAETAGDPRPRAGVARHVWTPS